MNKRALFINVILFMSFVFFGCQTKEKEKMDIKPPVAEKHPKELITHGDKRIDNYYWMNQRDDPKVIEYLEAENKYKDAMMKHTEGLQTKLYDEIVGRIKQDDESVPYFENGYYYYVRYEEGNEYPIYCRKKGNMDADEEVILNVNELAKGHDYYAATGLNVSPDNKYLAYGVDTVSRRRYDIFIKDLTTGKLLDDVVGNTTGQTEWANDNKTIFYVRKDEVTLRACDVYKHKIDQDADNDKLVFHEGDEEFMVYIYKTKSKKYIMIGSSQTLSTECRYIDADAPDGEFKIIQPRERDLEYSVDHYGDNFYIVTNEGGAKNFKLVKTPVDKTTKENWVDVIPHRDDTLLEYIEIFKDYLVLKERKDGLDQLRVKSWNGDTDYYIDFQDEAYAANVSVNPEFDSDLLRFSYSSLVTPNSTYDYNMKTKERELLKQTEVLGGFDSKNYVTKRVFAIARDGVKVPISLVYKKGLELNGNNPTLQYGYGSYGYSMSPGFRSAIFSLVDRGFVYAIAHIRGGEEMGREWYENGKLLKKKNTFTDFIDCSKYLIAQKYTSSDKLFIEGGSAGGLLIGAVVNMDPELYKGAIAAVPFVDVVTTMLDDSIPLTTFEYDEWGNPNQKEYYDYMLSYSPYDNVKAQDYPNMLVTTGYHDSQVQYWEPAKWVAKLRDMKTDNNLLVFDIDMESGHGGASGRFKGYKRTALEYAFMLDLLGIEN